MDAPTPTRAQLAISVPAELVELARNLKVRRIYECGSRDARDGLYLADAVGADALHIFECNPPSAAVCRANVAAHHSSDRALDAQVHEVAVAEREGPVTFYAIDTERSVTPHLDGNPGASSLYQANPAYPHEHYVQRPITVRAMPLREYANQYGTPDLLWMDLQGAELAALRGLGESLRDVRIVHTEVFFRPMFLGQPLFHEIDAYLKGLGFRRHALRLGRWPRLPWLYRLLRFGPWFGDAIYIGPSQHGAVARSEAGAERLPIKQ